MILLINVPSIRLSAFAVCTYLLSSCGQHEYRGYVYDRKTNLPLKDVSVKYNGQQVRSDKKGYFTLSHNGEVSKAMLFYKKNYKPAIAETIIIHAGETMEERFKDGHDTIYLTPKPDVTFQRRKETDARSTNEKWPISSDQFRKFYKQDSNTEEYSLIVPQGFQSTSYRDPVIPVKESPYGYEIKPGNQCLTAAQFKLSGVHCKIIVYNVIGENDSPVLNIQINSYNAEGQLQDALLLDSRFTFEVVYYRDFRIEANGNIIIKLYDKELYTYNEEGDITGNVKDQQVGSSSITYKLERDGKFRLVTQSGSSSQR